MRKIWLDGETTGLKSSSHDLVQIGAIYDDMVFNEFGQPLNWNNIDDAALKINNTTIDQLKTYQDQIVMLDKFISFMESIPGNGKFVIAGYNVDFDRKFIKELFKRHDKIHVYEKLFTDTIYDVYMKAKLFKSKIKSDNLKLVTLAGYFNIEIIAHDALSDIRATILLDKELDKLNKVPKFIKPVEETFDHIIVNTKFKEPAQLHNHSKYSLLDAIPSPKEWLEWGLKTGTPGISITDHGTAVSMYDIVQFPKYIKEYNKKNNTNYADDAVIGIPGVELYIKFDDDDKSHYHMCAWATSTEGYYNLMKMSSLGYEDQVKIFGNVKPRVTLDIIKKYRKGVKFGTACIGSYIGKAIIDDDEVLAEKRFKKFLKFFKDDLYVEFHPSNLTHNFDYKSGQHFKNNPTSLAPDGDFNKAYNKFLFKMVQKYNCKAIPATDAHFIAPEDKILQDVLLKNGMSNGWFFYESYHAKTAENIYKHLKSHIGDELTEEMFSQWIDNTHEIMLLAKSIKINTEYTLPVIEIPDYIKEKTDNYDKQLLYYTMEKIKEHNRWKNDKVYKDRFAKEIDVITKNGVLNFLPYFLLYEDIGSHVRSKGILQGIARGSAGGSLLSYYLKIIHVDPIEADLPFERFLSHSRIRAGSFPDIDQDIGDAARAHIVKYLKDKYKLGFAQICTHTTMKTKNAINDVMWALYGRNREDPEIKAIRATIPDSPQGTSEYDFLYGYYDKEGHYHKGHIEDNDMLRNFFTINPDVEKLVKRLIGVIRGFGRHASAFIVSSLDLASQRIPVTIMSDKNDMVGDIQVSQFDSKMCENFGLVKADILGVSTLTAVSEALDLIKERHNIDYREENEEGIQYIYRLPEDKGVYNDFYKKKTDSSFQFNTELVKGYIQQFNPSKRKDLKDLTALCRPGSLDAKITLKQEVLIEYNNGKKDKMPMSEHNAWLQKFKDQPEGGKIKSVNLIATDTTTATQFYLDVKNGIRPVQYLHPDLVPILKSTNGVIVYQEQLMKILVDIGNHTLEQSDIIRGAIAKKKQDVMIAAFDKIREGTRSRGWTSEQSETLCQQILAFAKYSFNLSHSHAYSELGYITMYLKHHYPLEWWCCILNLHLSSEAKMRKDVIYLGNLIKPPSIDFPSLRFNIRDKNIYAPISSIKGIGPKTIVDIMEKSPFSSFEDFMARIDHRRVNSGHFSALVKSRALDCWLNPNNDYKQEREKLLEKYLKVKKLSKKPRELFREKNCNLTDLQIFLAEKSVCTTFNKSLLHDKDIVKEFVSSCSILTATSNKHIPLMMGKVPILNNIHAAEGFLKQKYKGTIGMILFFESSVFRKGKSKKTGKPWSNASTVLSDGYNTLEVTSWDATKALDADKNELIYVCGTLKDGWRTTLSINASEIMPLSDLTINKETNE